MSNVASFLGRAGFAVEYIADANYCGIMRGTSEEVVSSLVKNFDYVRLPFVTYPSLLPHRFYRRLPTREQLEVADVNLILIDRVPPIAFLQRLKHTRVPTVLLMHGLSIGSKLPPQPLTAAYLMYLRSAGKSLRILSESDHVFFQVLSEGQRAVLVRFGIRPTNVFTIPSGVALDDIPFPAPHDGFGVLFMGRIERLTKGVDLLVETLQSLESIKPEGLHVNVIGSGKDSDMLRRFQGSSIIKCAGFVSIGVRRNVLRESDLFLGTSFVEPFSLATVEALASGCFVLTTPCQGPMSIVSTSPDLGQVLTFDSKSFVKEILRYYRRWQLSDDHLLGERERRASQVRVRFATDVMSQAYLELVRNVISVKAPGSRDRAGVAD